MTLEDKFQVNHGDLVLFTSKRTYRPSLVGYVINYSGKQVKLTNRGIYLQSELRFREINWLCLTFEAFNGSIKEKKYSVKLDEWDEYEILKEANKIKNKI